MWDFRFTETEQKHPFEVQNTEGASNKHSKLPNNRLFSTQSCFVVCPIQVLCLNHAFGTVISPNNSPTYENEVKLISNL